MHNFDFVLMRGGTSKAVFFHEQEMPDRGKWAEFLLDVMGSPDKRQIDGMGGANSLTSKVAIIAKSTRKDADVDYTFAQVSLTDRLVDFKGNCGNISSAVGPFSANEGLVKAPRDGRATVRIFNVNTNKVIESEFEMKDGRFLEKGDSVIPGVPGSASAVWLLFNNPGGAVTGKTLPTGNASDVIATSRGEVRISIVDAANPLVFMRAGDVGLDGTEMPEAFGNGDLNFIEEIRSIAAELCGLASRESATAASPAVPKSAVISPPAPYAAMNGKRYEAEDVDIAVRMMSMQRPHEALAITGAICVTFASSLRETLVGELLADRESGAPLRIGHPGGVMEAVSKMGGRDEKEIAGVKVLRTAREIARGALFTKGEY